MLLKYCPVKIESRTDYSNPIQSNLNRFGTNFPYVKIILSLKPHVLSPDFCMYWNILKLGLRVWECSMTNNKFELSKYMYLHEGFCLTEHDSCDDWTRYVDGFPLTVGRSISLMLRY